MCGVGRWVDGCVWQQPSREYISTYLLRTPTQRAGQGHNSSLSSSRAGPGLDFFHTVELCRNALAGYPSSAMHIYSVSWMLGQSVALCPEVPVLIFKSTPVSTKTHNSTPPITERGPSLLEALCSAYWAIRRARYELTDETTLL